MVMKVSRKNKNPPMLSHEFVIQNHGDIVSCVAMVIVLGLMVQATSPVATMFIIPQHMVESAAESGPDAVTLYTNGLQDIATIFFYMLITVVVHAIAQDYILDRVNRKLHLSKLKHAKFNECGQIVLFSVFSALWGMQVMFKDEVITSFSSLWANYPEGHNQFTFRTKFYFIIQIAYWLHSYPELYFQKVKREDMRSRIVYATLHLILVTGAYVTNMTRLASVLLLLHYICEALLHLSRLLHYAELTSYASQGFGVYNAMFIGVRLISFILAIVAFQFGLGSSSNQGLDLVTGKFNTPLTRGVSLGALFGVQAYMLWCFITYHLAKKREKEEEVAAAQSKKKITKKTRGRSSDEEVNLLPEVDQNTRRRR